ncbi:MAG: Fe-S cluster assembly protein SufD [Chthoniobacterales bacterium]
MTSILESPAVTPSASHTITPSPELALTPTFDAAWPAWFHETQREAWEEFLRTPAPTRKDEAWRFANIKAVRLDEFVPAPAFIAAADAIAQSKLFDAAAARFVFGNNQLIHREGSALPEGVIVKPLAEAARENESLFREFFMSQPVELGSHRFAALHRAMVQGGIMIHVPANVEVSLPIEIFHWVEGDNASVFPHTLILCGENSKVTVVDVFKSIDNARAFACGVNDLHLADGAELTYVAVQDWSPSSLAFHINSTLVGRNATATALNVNFGSKFLRGESLSRLNGEGSRSVMLSINPVDGDREIDQRTLQDHVSPRATSDLLYQNALDGSARTIFAGLIKVGEGAHETDAYQKVRNLLLSDDCEANSMPGLEILADNVRCSHGATSGEINEDELFYMQARGISADLGRRLIVAGFFNSLLDRIGNDDVRAKLSALVSDRLGV